MKLPPQVAGAWGTSGEIPTAQGVAADDLGVGRGSFEGAYNGANGNLDDLNKRGSQILFGVNVLGDSHAGVTEKSVAVVTIIAATAAVEGAALTGITTAGIMTAAMVAQAAPVLGQITAAFVILVAVVFQV